MPAVEKETVPEEPRQRSTGQGGILGSLRMLWQSAQLVTIELLTKILGLIVFIKLAREVGADNLGVYYYGLSLASFFVIGAAFGFERLVQKETGRKPSLALQLFREIGLLKIGLSTISLGAMWLALLLLREEQPDLLILVGLFIFLQSFMNFVNALFRGLGRPWLEIADRGVFSILNLILGFWALHVGLGLPGFIGMQILATAIALLTALALMHTTSDQQRLPITGERLFGHLKNASPLAMVVVIIYFMTQVNVVVLSQLGGDTAVGYYAGAARIYEMLALVPAAVMGVFLPTMSRLYHRSVTRMRNTLLFGFRLLYMLAIPIAAGTWVIGDNLVMFLYGPNFEPSGLTMKVLHTAAVFIFLNFACVNLLVARDRESKLVRFFLFIAIINVVGTSLFIFFLDHLGAAIGALVTQAVQFILFWRFIGRYIRPSVFFASMGGPTLSALIMMPVTWLLLPINLILAIAGGAVTYAGALLLTGSLRKRDLQMIGDL